jgi:hypothetical protein
MVAMVIMVGWLVLVFGWFGFLAVAWMAWVATPANGEGKKRD